MEIDWHKVKSASLLLYGAGRMAAQALAFVRSQGAEPVALVDRDPLVCAAGQAGGGGGAGIPIISPDVAKERYPDFYVYLTMAPPLRYRVQEQLLDSGFCSKDKIVNHRPVQWRKGCTMLNGHLLFEGVGMTFCCGGGIGEKQKNLPRIPYTADPSNDIRKIVEYKQKILEGIQRGEHTPCDGCCYLVEDYWPEPEDGFSCLVIGMSILCQLRCIYCCHHEHMQGSSFRQSSFDLMKTLAVLRDERLIDALEHIVIASGEITVLPERDALLDWAEGVACTILTNAVVYSDRVARNMLTPGSYLSVSVDSGTRETFLKVKGGDHFEKVKANIRRYRDNGVNVILKYIVLPENNRQGDFDGFCDICLENRIGHVQVDVDGHADFHSRPEAIKNGVAKLTRKLRDAGIRATINTVFLSTNDLTEINEMLERI